MIRPLAAATPSPRAVHGQLGRSPRFPAPCLAGGQLSPRFSAWATEHVEVQQQVWRGRASCWATDRAAANCRRRSLRADGLQHPRRERLQRLPPLLRELPRLLLLRRGVPRGWRPVRPDLIHGKHSALAHKRIAADLSLHTRVLPCFRPRATQVAGALAPSAVVSAPPVLPAPPEPTARAGWSRVAGARPADPAGVRVGGAGRSLVADPPCWELPGFPGPGTSPCRPRRRILPS